MSNIQSCKQKLTMQQWKVIIEDRMASGLKIDDYCELNQLSRNSYFYWLRKIREEMLTPSSSSDSLPTTITKGALVELVPTTKHNVTVPQIEIPDAQSERMSFSVNGISITIDYDMSEELLSKIMRAARNA